MIICAQIGEANAQKEQRFDCPATKWRWLMALL